MCLPFPIPRICSDTTVSMFTAFSLLSTLLTVGWNTFCVCPCFQVIGKIYRCPLDKLQPFEGREPFFRKKNLFFFFKRIFFFNVDDIYLCNYFWLGWVFMRTFCSCDAWRLLLLQSVGSKCAGSVAVANGLSFSAPDGIFRDQGLNPYPLNWQVYT